MAIAYFFLRATEIASRLGLLGAPARVMTLLLVFTLACTATIFWEFAEFFCDRYLGSHAQGGVFDTLKDMFFGMVGAVALLLRRSTPRVTMQ